MENCLYLQLYPLGSLLALWASFGGFCVQFLFFPLPVNSLAVLYQKQLRTLNFRKFKLKAFKQSVANWQKHSILIENPAPTQGENKQCGIAKENEWINNRIDDKVKLILVERFEPAHYLAYFKGE